MPETVKVYMFVTDLLFVITLKLLLEFCGKLTVVYGSILCRHKICFKRNASYNENDDVGALVAALLAQVAALLAVLIVFPLKRLK